MCFYFILFYLDSSHFKSRTEITISLSFNALESWTRGFPSSSQPPVHRTRSVKSVLSTSFCHSFTIITHSTIQDPNANPHDRISTFYVFANARYIVPPPSSPSSLRGPGYWMDHSHLRAYFVKPHDELCVHILALYEQKSPRA